MDATDPADPMPTTDAAGPTDAAGRSPSEVDVVVIGGGAAGLSAAVALGRSLRSVLVIDSGQPRNAPAAHAHNVLTRDGTPPAELLALGRDEVRRYGGRVESGRVTGLRRADAGFTIGWDGPPVRARRVLIATGVRDELPDVPGLAEHWGRDVLHCPYCHGWEVRGRRIGVLATGPMAAHQALLFAQLSPSVSLLQHTGPAPTPEQAAQLAAIGVASVDGEVVGVESDPGGLRAVALAGGGRVELDALVVAPRPVVDAPFLTGVGLRPVEVRVGEHVIATRIETDATGATAIRGLWAAGNVADPQAQVIGSAAAGLMAGAAINADLIAEDATAAVRLRSPGG